MDQHSTVTLSLIVERMDNIDLLSEIWIVDINES